MWAFQSVQVARLGINWNFRSFTWLNKLFAGWNVSPGKEPLERGGPSDKNFVTCRLPHLKLGPITVLRIQ